MKAFLVERNKFIYLLFIYFLSSPANLNGFFGIFGKNYRKQTYSPGEWQSLNFPMEENVDSKDIGFSVFSKILKRYRKQD